MKMLFQSLFRCRSFPRLIGLTSQTIFYWLNWLTKLSCHFINIHLINWISQLMDQSLVCFSLNTQISQNWWIYQNAAVIWHTEKIIWVSLDTKCQTQCHLQTNDVPIRDNLTVNQLVTRQLNRNAGSYFLSSSQSHRCASRVSTGLVHINYGHGLLSLTTRKCQNI